MSVPLKTKSPDLTWKLRQKDNWTQECDQKYKKLTRWQLQPQLKANNEPGYNKLKLLHKYILQIDKSDYLAQHKIDNVEEIAKNVAPQD